MLLQLSKRMKRAPSIALVISASLNSAITPAAVAFGNDDDDYDDYDYDSCCFIHCVICDRPFEYSYSPPLHSSYVSIDSLHFSYSPQS